MRALVLILAFVLSPSVIAGDGLSDANRCREYVKAGENYKLAHTNPHCLRAAKAGNASAQYSVGMGYGFANQPALEEAYYRKAANNQGVAAYLALGHVLVEEKPWEAIYWYQRHVAVKPDGYGYTAILISQVFKRLGDEEQAKYWRAVCAQSPYRGCED